MPYKITVLALAAGSMLSVASAASTNEYCVRCTGPDQTYTCAFDGAPASLDAGLKLYCITALAQSGPHASCAIDRNASTPCSGERKLLPLPEALQSAQTDPEGGGGRLPPLPQHKPEVAPPQNNVADPAADGQQSSESKEPQAEPAAKPEAPPRTVEEMVVKGTKSASESIAKSGEKASDAAKSTWKCLTSLFSNC